MKKFIILAIVLLILSVLQLACGGGQRAFDNFRRGSTETWESQPLYGEIRFYIFDQATGEPMPNVSLDVKGFPLAEFQDEQSNVSDQNGRIQFQQLTQGITYIGDGPPRPAFIFSFDESGEHTVTVDYLDDEIDYPVLGSSNLPTVRFINKNNQEEEIPLHLFAIYFDGENGIEVKQIKSAELNELFVLKLQDSVLLENSDLLITYHGELRAYLESGEEENLAVLNIHMNDGIDTIRIEHQETQRIGNYNLTAVSFVSSPIELQFSLFDESGDIDDDDKSDET